MREENLKEYYGYGFISIGDTEDNETIVVKRFENKVIMVMMVHDQYVTQVRLQPEHMEKLIAFALD